MTTNICISISFSLLVCIVSSQPLFNATTDPMGTEGSNPLVAATEGTNNVSITCEVFRISDGSQRQTAWTLIRDGADNVLLFENGLGVMGFENFVVVESERAQLTILDFNSSFDNTQLGCGAGSEIAARFDLRIIKTPVLINGATVQTVAEDNSFSLNAEIIPGFPVIPDSFTWFFNGIEISLYSLNPNVSLYPNISFENVNRSSAGNYTITVTNEGGTVSTSFILDVQYKPEGVALSGPEYVLAGEDVTLVAFTDIDGNPEPSSTWSFGGNTLSGVKFNTSVLGQLAISSTTLSDSGNYINTLMNTVDGNLANSIELIVAEAPSVPRNPTVLVVGAEFVNISWINPMNIGTPTFTRFRIVAISTINTINVSITATNTVDVEFVNMYVVDGLKPTTEYTITIRASSTVEQLGVLVSEPSESIVFNTTLGGPSIRTALVSNINGNLSVSWEFLHTGGSDLQTVTVQCSEEDEDSVDGASADPLAVILYCSATVDCVMGCVSVGPVTAGGNYSCLVTAENSAGRDEMRTDYIIATTGIPSVPVIISILGGAGFATITLRVDNFGVLVATDFTFIVSVFSPSDTSNPVAVRMITPDSVDTPMVTIVVDLSKGTYVFSVVSGNSFSPTSDPSSISGSAVVQQRPSTTTTVSVTPTTTITTTSSSTSSTGVGTEPTGSVGSSSSALPGGAIAGIVIAIIILIAIIAIVVFIVFYVIYQNRGGSYQVEAGKRGGIKVEELDIDIGTELKNTETTEGLLEKPPTTSETSTSAEPRQELHYADLADFGPIKSSKGPSAPAPQAKPMPIEEVQYAVIVPQSQKPPAEDGAE